MAIDTPFAQAKMPEIANLSSDIADEHETQAERDLKPMPQMTNPQMMNSTQPQQMMQQPMNPQMMNSMQPQQMMQQSMNPQMMDPMMQQQMMPQMNPQMMDPMMQQQMMPQMNPQMMDPMMQQQMMQQMNPQMMDPMMQQQMMQQMNPQMMDPMMQPMNMQMMNLMMQQQMMQQQMQPFEFDEADFAELDIITLSESEYSNAQEDVKLGYIQTTIYAFLDKNKEKIAPLLMSKLGEKALRSLHSDSAVEKLAGTIHSLLPFAIKLVLKEEVVVNFSKRNRTVLIQKLSEIESLRPLLINSK